METNTSIVSAPQSVIADFVGGSTGEVEMMIGVGLVKDSEAVFFQYMGENSQPTALMMPNNGKPLTRLANVKLTGLTIAEDVGEFKSTKLNVYLESSAGRTIMLTSGLSTIWSQCLISSLMGLYHSYDLDRPFNLDTWKGTSKMRPCFAGVRIGRERINSEDLKNMLQEARADRDSAKVNKLLRGAVATIAGALKEQTGVDEVTVEVEDAVGVPVESTDEANDF